MPTKSLALVITATLAASLLTGCSTGGTNEKQLKLAAAHLEPFSSCDDLLKWQIDHNLNQVGPYGWGGDTPVIAYREDAAAPKASGSAPAQGQDSSATGTNTQEADVDEPDFAKTNGKIVYSTRQNRIVATDVTGPEPRELGRYTFPNNVFIADLLLVDNHVIATADTPMEKMMDAPVPGGGYFGGGTTIHDLDFADPAAPKLVATRSYSGRRVSARQYGDVVRLVLTDGLPELKFVTPDQDITKKQATERNREILKQTQIADWLPTVTENGASRPLVDCADVRHPQGAEGGQTVTVVSYDANASDRPETTAITAAGEVVYSSTDSLYVTSTNWDEQPWLLRRMASPRVTTDIHQFALDGMSTKYAASGRIQGTIRDQWSLDEYDGDLRVARGNLGKGGEVRDNGVVVLRRDGNQLKVLGQLNSLGVDEEIQSVRWMDDLAVVVTFRQTDPLYTIDLADPAQPKLLGALKITGFSAYLHPIGKQQFLGIGVDADYQGRNVGAQLATFDLTDLSQVRQVQVQRFGRYSSLAASYDPKAFTWLSKRRTAITLAMTEMANKLVFIKVADDGTFTMTERPVSQGEYAVRALPLANNEVAVVSNERVELVAIP